MTEAKDFKVIMPLGWEAGREVGIGDALAGLSIEMLAERSDLLARLEKEELPELAREAGRRRAADLERYATAINSLSLQLQPERFKPEYFTGLIELARLHNVALPAWMTGEN